MARLLMSDEEWAFFEPFLALVRGQGGRPASDHRRVLGGGFTTTAWSPKDHLRTNGHGLPMKAEITPGQASDYTGYDAIDDQDLPPAKVLIADKGYDADAIRDGVEAKGGTPVIPARKNRKHAESIDRFAYALRNRIERAFNRLKNARRFATRYDKTSASYLGFVHIVSARIWLRSLST